MEDKKQPLVKLIKAKSNLVDFKVTIKFNSYKRGQVLKKVDRKKAEEWVKKERGLIIEINA